MSASEHQHEDMWRSPILASVGGDDESAEGATPSRTIEERAVEDAWYQVLRRKHVEEAEDE